MNSDAFFGAKSTKSSATSPSEAVHTSPPADVADYAKPAVCPHCGTCPTCGRRNDFPGYGYYWPPVWTPPYAQTTIYSQHT